MAVGFFSVRGVDYLASENGSRVTGAWVEKEGRILLAGFDGSLKEEAHRAEDGNLFLRDAEGSILLGWQNLRGYTFYANPDLEGRLAKGWFALEDGLHWAKGWFALEDGLHWANDQYIVGSGWELVNENWYWFDANRNNALATGWQKIGGVWYYPDESSGAMATGWTEIGGAWYEFDSSGAWISPEATMTKKAQSFSSVTNWLVLVDTANNYVGIFHGSQGDWSMRRYTRCTSGAPNTPTVKGSFTVGSRGLSFGKGYTCWYWTQFCGNYLFHTVLYNPGSMTSIQDGRLGINASHGCVRLSMDDAKWIYNNIPSGTKVYVY